MNGHKKNDPKDKRQKVLDTTLEMIMEHGVQATSMSKVSKASGVAVGTIYHHFESKEAIITELYRHFKTEMLEAMTGAAYKETDIKEGFVQTILGLIRFSKANPYALEFCETFASSPIIDSNVKEEVASKFYGYASNMINEIKSMSNNAQLTDEMIFVYFNGTVFSMVRAQTSGSINWSEKEIRHFLDMVWKGLVL